MKKIILLTGATDGIGFETAKKLASQGHTLLLHGRNEEKLAHTKLTLSERYSEASIETYQADLSNLSEVDNLVANIKANHAHLDVLINNAGVFKTPQPITDKGFDVRFIVNTIAPYVLTQQLLPLFTTNENTNGRIINLSSAAQAPVNFEALKGHQRLSDSDAYAQSKLAITMWTYQLAASLASDAPTIIAVNPASFLGSKMVKEAYGSEGKDLMIGVDILVRAALSDEFTGITGRYFDNDSGNWSQPHPDALDEIKNQQLVTTIDDVLKQHGITQ